MNFAQSETKINLMKAFAGESQARNRYNISAKIAEKEGFHIIGKLFNTIADQERQHAKIFYNYLIPLNGEKIEITADFPINNSKSTLEMLNFAVLNELEEYNNAYKRFAEVAEKEGFIKISKTFNEIADIEKIHAQRFEKFAKLLKSGELFAGDEKTVWMCEKCGHIVIGKKPPKECPVCGHPIDYFIRAEYLNM